MKKLFLISGLIFGLSFLFTGCYTVIWDPSEEFSEVEEESGNSEFYETDYYGEYGDYYGTPWWAGIFIYNDNNGGTNDQNVTKERNNERTAEREKIRNSGGRGNTDRNPGNSNNTTTTVTPPPAPPTPTINTGSTSGSSSGSGSSSSSNDNSSSTRSSSGSGDARNDSGSRNSGNGRR